MNIIVCIKQVPDTTEVRIDPQTNTLVREGVPSIINPFDENAIECGLQLVEKHGGKVTVISMGPPQAEQALRDALARGAMKRFCYRIGRLPAATGWRHPTRWPRRSRKY